MLHQTHKLTLTLMAPILLIILFSLLALKTKTEEALNIKSQCPQLTFPQTNFKFICNQNKTTIHFDSYGDLIVKSISYQNPKRIDLVDPKNCVHRVFFNLNLTLTPFDYYYAVKNFTYLNCSALIPGFTDPVPCLSESEFYVYVVEPSFEVPTFCTRLRTVGIPFGYSDYLDDDRFGLGLTWNTNHSYEAHNALHTTVLCASFFILMSAIVMIGVKMYHSKKLDTLNQIKMNQFDVDNFVGDFEAL